MQGLERWVTGVVFSNVFWVKVHFDAFGTVLDPERSLMAGEFFFESGYSAQREPR